MIKTRHFADSNYHSIYCNGKTMRIPIDASKPITELEYPEFYDVKLTSKCSGKCPYCYMDSIEQGDHFYDAVEKINDFFGEMTPNQRPFQVALGGGNPNEHPDFCNILKKFSDLDITPNYTTNGMGLTDEVMEATIKYCGGVAVSCHPHLKSVWENAAEVLLESGIKTAFHHIISDKESVDRFLSILNDWKKVDYHVLLPLIAQGRAKETLVDNEYLFGRLLELPKEIMQTVAFGAKFYPELCSRRGMFEVSLYEPEILSKYLDLSNMKLYGSSFEASA